MSLDLNINTADIEQALIDSVASGVIGEKIKENFTKLIDDYQLTRIIEDALKDFVYGSLTSFIDSNMKETIRKKSIELLKNKQDDFIERALLDKIKANIKIEVEEDY